MYSFTKYCDVFKLNIFYIEICQDGFTAAYAGPCYTEPTMENRPYIGYVNFCPAVSQLSLWQ